MKLSKGNIVRIIMWLIMVFGGAFLSIYFDYEYFKDLFYNLTFHTITFILGFILLRLVIKASKNTGRYLKENGREGNIPRLQTNKLVTDGLYGCMRHPMHFGLMFFFLAFALLIGSPVFIFIIAPSEMLFMIIMIKLFEEKEAFKKFGQDYLEYKKNVPFYSIKKECLMMLLKK
jgi:protein-S-isoprenylcysteine O-methyltransferase Ste14